MKTKVKLRKEKRKEARSISKIKKRGLQSTDNRAKTKESSVVRGPLLQILGRKTKASSVASTASHAAKLPSGEDALIEAEDMEIERLEKLLGIVSKKGAGGDSKLADKLDKEFELYEGLGDGFGSFLLGLDAIGQRDAPQEDEDMSEGDEGEGHMIHDSEQEGSDSDLASVGPSNSSNSLSCEEAEGGSGDEDGESWEGEADEPRSEGDEETDGAAEESHTYQPRVGEDIYGRATGSATGAYVPPSRRPLAAVDEATDAYKLLRRQVNGLMNRLSDQSKDSVARSLKGLYDANSVTVTSHVLNACIVAACSNASQIMTSLAPLYAGIVAALHFTVGTEVGAFITELLFVSLGKELGSSPSSGTTADIHDLISSKLPANVILLLVYLYNYRVLHHAIIVDILQRLAGGWAGSGAGSTEVELIVLMIDHCGVVLRGDDPLGLKTIIATVTECTKSNRDDKRVAFMLELLADLRNNKSRRVQASNNEAVKSMRKWLGNFKSMVGAKSGDLCLRVTMQDLLDVDKKGRWWIAGASWKAKDESEVKATPKASTDTASAEESFLSKLADKMRMTTGVRRSVFMVVMSSRDVGDAFERLARLDLKGKQDRDVVRVLFECCAQEKSYNSFYAELMSLFCSQNRQYKTTAQYAYWDFYKNVLDDPSSVTERRIINLARMLAHLVCEFHLSIAVIKPLDIQSLNDSFVLFLSTLLLVLFSSKTKQDVFHQAVDRIATSKDFASVRETLIVFLQRYLVSIPNGFDGDDALAMKKRKHWMVKTLEEMSIIEMVAGSPTREDDFNFGGIPH